MTAGSDALSQMQQAGLPVRGVLHVGANVGQERIDYLSAGVTPVIYVEPISTVYAQLEYNLLGMPGHIPVQAVCSDRSGERVSFFISDDDREAVQHTGPWTPCRDIPVGQLCRG